MLSRVSRRSIFIILKKKTKTHTHTTYSTCKHTNAKQIDKGIYIVSRVLTGDRLTWTCNTLNTIKTFIWNPSGDCSEHREPTHVLSTLPSIVLLLQDVMKLRLMSDLARYLTARTHTVHTHTRSRIVQFLHFSEPCATCTPVPFF